MQGLTLYQLTTTALSRRRDLGLSQTALSERLGRSRTWVTDFERGHGEASVADVLRLLDVLGLGLVIADSDEEDELDDLLRTHQE